MYRTCFALVQMIEPTIRYSQSLNMGDLEDDH